mmetsp:Transcript_5143/g.15203  ORF Transcript_5143/g.15203 Transcript_5143/m.15203 type:complete len:366 (+) Transcript_5143:132-1229(+)
MLRLLCSVALAGPAWGLNVQAALASRRDKHHLVVCNAFPDARPAVVGERLAPLHDLAAEAVGVVKKPPAFDGGAEVLDFMQLRVDEQPHAHTKHRSAHRHGHQRASVRGRRLLHFARRQFSMAPTDTMWTRALSYGTCEEYYMNLDLRRLFFIAPGGEHMCELTPEVALPREATDGTGLATPRLAVVLRQPSAASKQCAIHTVAMPLAGAGPVATSELPMLPAEMVAIDAFTAMSPLEAHTMETVGGEEADAGGDAGSTPLQRRFDASAELRLEDAIDASSISAEVVGSRLLALDEVYMVEPRAFHLVLEDLQGTRVLDHTLATLAPKDVVLALRIGRGGDEDFPERLLLYKCFRKDAEAAPPPL